MFEEKVWGTARHIFSSPHCAVSILTTVKGGYCSRHKHSSRVNRFVVSSGSIDVVEYTEDGNSETLRKTLKAGETIDVQAGIIHRFEVNEPGLVVEVYWPSNKYDEVRLTDIERLDAGGIK